LRDKADLIEGKGATLVIVGSGKPFHARGFREDEGLSGPILLDEERVAYTAAHLKRGLSKTLGPRSLLAGVKSFRKGFRQKTTEGDPYQQGGVFVLGPENTVRYAHIDRFAGDHAPIDDVIAALG
jgi:peroxiredoxin